MPSGWCGRFACDTFLFDRGGLVWRGDAVIGGVVHPMQRLFRKLKKHVMHTEQSALLNTMGAGAVGATV